VSTIGLEGADGVGVPSAATGPSEGTSLGLGLSGNGTLGAGGGGAGGTFGAVITGGPESRFFGQRGNAYKVVYVIDTSASLWDAFELAQRELIDSIERLTPQQSFHVIFAGDTPLELPARQLVPAITAFKEPAKKFILDLVVKSRCDPVAAMERAFACNPELIYFLTDGEHKLYREQLLARLREWNADKRVHITTIGFGDRPDSRATGALIGESLLRQIALEHGGNFRWVSPDEAGEGGK
jgi:hypothetical protein